MRQALASTEHGYDLLAPKFDFTPFRTPEPVLEAMAEVIAAGGPIASALDVCCGTGAAMRHLRPLCSERVIGLDFSRGMLDEARRRLADAPGDAAIDFVHGDALALPFYREIDVITSVGAFGHILPEEEDRFVSEIARSLVPGGRFVFATTREPTPRDPWYWLANGFNAAMRLRNFVLRPAFVMYYLTFQWPHVRPLLERHGFRLEMHHELCPAPYDRVVIVSATRTS